MLAGAACPWAGLGLEDPLLASECWPLAGSLRPGPHGPVHGPLEQSHGLAAAFFHGKLPEVLAQADAVMTYVI